LPSPSEKLKIAFQLHDAGMQLVRRRYAREHPRLGARAIDRLVLEWLADRPPDASGRPVDLRRFGRRR
jgi:hypothetical protein